MEQAVSNEMVCVNDKENTVHSLFILFYILAMFVTEKAVKINNQTNNIRQTQMYYLSLIQTTIFNCLFEK